MLSTVLEFLLAGALVLEALVLFGFWGVLAIALVLGVYALMPLLRWLV
jgi:hypothetical protein